MLYLQWLYCRCSGKWYGARATLHESCCTHWAVLQSADSDSHNDIHVVSAGQLQLPFANRQTVEDTVHKVAQRLGLVPYLHCFTRESHALPYFACTHNALWQPCVYKPIDVWKHWFQTSCTCNVACVKCRCVFYTCSVQ